MNQDTYDLQRSVNLLKREVEELKRKIDILVNFLEHTPDMKWTVKALIEKCEKGE